MNMATVQFLSFYYQIPIWLFVD